MCETSLSLSQVSDDDLIARVKECVSNERKATAQLLACLGELDQRRLYLAQGFSSLFTYCTGHLHLSERAAYSRIEAARLARRFPIVLEFLADGRLSLTVVSLLARHLTAENHRGLLAKAAHRATREVEVLIASIKPAAVSTQSLRRLPMAKPIVVVEKTPQGPLLDAPGDSHPAVHAVRSRPINASPDAGNPPTATEERYSLRVTISKAAHSELMRARDLMRHTVPSGDLALVLERAISSLLSDLETRKLALVTRPRAAGRRRARTDTRYIPADVRREVWRRDGARCAFIGPAGRCVERGFLELHHVLPFAEGGQATAQNIELRCRAHNAHEAQVYFGGTRAP